MGKNSVDLEVLKVGYVSKVHRYRADYLELLTMEDLYHKFKDELESQEFDIDYIKILLSLGVDFKTSIRPDYYSMKLSDAEREVDYKWMCNNTLQVSLHLLSKDPTNEKFLSFNKFVIDGLSPIKYDDKYTGVGDFLFALSYGNVNILELLANADAALFCTESVISSIYMSLIDLNQHHIMEHIIQSRIDIGFKLHPRSIKGLIRHIIQKKDFKALDIIIKYVGIESIYCDDGDGIDLGYSRRLSLMYSFSNEAWEIENAKKPLAKYKYKYGYKLLMDGYVLNVAVVNNDYELLNHLINRGMNMNFIGKNNDHVLLYAKDTNMLKFLIESGADPNFKLKEHTILLKTLAKDGDQTDVLRILLDSGVDVDLAEDVMIDIRNKNVEYYNLIRKYQQLYSPKIEPAKLQLANVTIPAINSNNPRESFTPKPLYHNVKSSYMKDGNKMRITFMDKLIEYFEELLKY